MPEVVIANTSPLQYLFQIEMIELLRSRYGKVLVPEAVVAELERGREQGISLPDPAELPWIQIRRVAHGSLLPLAADLGPGEREVLALTAETPGAVALLDDALARRYARNLKLSCTGTLGILLRAREQGLVGELRPVIDRLENLGFRLDPQTRLSMLSLAGE